MKRILVITWYYPPINSSEGLVTYKLLKNSKYEYDVFTQKENTLWSYGNKEKFPDAKNVNCIFSKKVTLEDWKRDAIEFYKKNADKYDVVMTRSMPPESHEVGLEIKKINPNVKWIASFGDPIGNNPFVKISMQGSSPHTIRCCESIKGVFSPKRLIRQILFYIKKRKQNNSLMKDVKLQNLIIKKANCLIFNNYFQQEYMLKDNQKNNNKAYVIPHSFDESLYKRTETNKNDKIQMTYIGHLDQIRTPRILFNAVKSLHNKDEKLAERVQLNFYGDLSNEDKIFIIDEDLTDIIKVKKPVSYLESLEIMKKSDWLIHIDANIISVTDNNIFFAAKLSDYIGASRNIFGITMLNGSTYEILTNVNAVITSYSQEEIKNYLWLIIYKNLSKNLNEEYSNKFNSKTVAKEFDNIIEEI